MVGRRGVQVRWAGVALAVVALVACSGGDGGGSDPCEDTSCSEHGSCAVQGDEAICVCEPGWAGESCEACYPGYHASGDGSCVLDQRCAATSCSGHGTCDDEAGTPSCQCATGYAGDGCQSCAEGFHRDEGGDCEPDERCADGDPCGANGTCEDAGGVVRCECSDGYAGATCAACYPGYHDVGGGACELDETCREGSCAGHGTCSVAAGVVSCDCDDGYGGAACTSCAEGYHRDADDGCVEDETCGAGDPCGEHGACDDTGGVVSCACEAGWAGPACGSCAAGFHPDAEGGCAADARCSGNTCSGAGECIESDDSVSCDCDDGYDGSWCESCAAGFHRDDTGACVADESCTDEAGCEPGGTCNDSGGVVRCECKAAFAGPTCKACYPGYHDDGFDGCELDRKCLATSCSGRGECSDGGGVVSCACSDGYGGDACEVCDEGYHRAPAGACVPDELCSDGDPCGEHGTCGDATGTIVCACGPGYAGATCADCAVGFHPDGQVACVLDQICASFSCSGAGDCDDAGGTVTCDCSDGYAGNFCEQCEPGYHRDELGACVANVACGDVDPCGPRGTCTEVAGQPVCVCEPGYTGAACDSCYPGYHDNGVGSCLLDQTCLVTSCSGAGDCAAEGGVVTCDCDDGYGGPWCESCDAGYVRAPAGGCVPVESCSGGEPCGAHGSCDDSTGLIVCKCAVGWDGESCDRCYPGYALNGVTGTCEIPCDGGDGFVRCDGVCVDILSPDNCGACGNDCAGGYCDSSAGAPSCACPLDEGRGFCGSAGEEVCTDLRFDEAHCGDCQTSCGDGQKCFLGACRDVALTCGIGCVDDENLCCADGTCLYATDAASDPLNCGGCGIVCDEGAVCSGGRCVSGNSPGGCGGTGNPSCMSGYEVCCDDGLDGVCVASWNFPSNSEHCGACSVACADNELCRSGGCVCPEDQGYGVCGGACLDVSADNANCGDCGVECDVAGGERCVEGRCMPSNADCGGSCTDSQICCATTLEPFAVCFEASSLSDDADRCGACDVACREGETCAEGNCVCDAPFRICGNACVDTTSPEHCGGCDGACAGDELCVPGAMGDYVCDCPDDVPGSTHTLCGGVCTDTSTNEAHCGGCGQPCTGEGEICVGGHCVAGNSAACGDCGGDALCCGDEAAGICLQTATMLYDMANCGGCGIACGSAEQCNNGICTCPSELGDATYDICGGECVSVAYDERHCGQCGESCPEPDQLCAGGRCLSPTSSECGVDGTCGADSLCCDSPGGFRCVSQWEFSYSSEHCGACGAACTDSGYQCFNGECLCTDDFYEDNDSPEAAVEVFAGAFDVLNLCPGDEDYFAISIPPAGQLTVTVTFQAAEGNVDLELYDGGGALIGASTGSGDSEQVTWTNSGATDARVVVRIFNDGALQTYEITYMTGG